MVFCTTVRDFFLKLFLDLINNLDEDDENGSVFFDLMDFGVGIGVQCQSHTVKSLQYTE